MNEFNPVSSENNYTTKSVERLAKMRNAIDDGHAVDYIATNTENFVVLADSVPAKPDCLYLVFAYGDDVTFVNCSDEQHFSSNVLGQIEIYVQNNHLVILAEDKNGKFILNHGFKKHNSENFFLAYFYSTKAFVNLVIVDSSKNKFSLNTWEPFASKFPCKELFFYVCQTKFPNLKWEGDSDDELPFL